jgi:hypothetical protein
VALHPDLADPAHCAVAVADFDAVLERVVHALNRREQLAHPLPHLLLPVVDGVVGVVEDDAGRLVVRAEAGVLKACVSTARRYVSKNFWAGVAG